MPLQLNPQQLEAVQHIHGPLLIIAGAGTGKTRVITERISCLINNRHANPGEILALTFSNKAAQEMRERVEATIQKSFEEIWISTFHSFCADILRENALRFGLNPFFRLITEPEQISLLVRELNSLQLAYYGKSRSIDFLATHFISVISRAKDEMITSEEYQAYAQKKKHEKPDDEETLKALDVAAAYQLYEKVLIRNDALDFGDLILYTIQNFRSKPGLLKHYQKKFRFILVDEYQDTNFAQAQLLYLLAESHRNLCVVGDDDQSIYRFRGASVKNILEFRNKFRGCKEVTLTTNYRSLQPILDRSGTLIRRNTERLPKQLQAERREKKLALTFDGTVQAELFSSSVPADAVSLLSFKDEILQAKWIVQEIQRLMYNDPDLKISDIAILSRSVKYQIRSLVRELEQSYLPFEVIGGTGFFEREEVQDMLAWLRAIAYPLDDVSWMRALSRSPIGLTALDLARIMKYSYENGKLHLFDGLRTLSSIRPDSAEIKKGSGYGIDGELLQKIRNVHELICEWVNRSETNLVDVLVEEVLNRTRYREKLVREASRESLVKLTNLEKFFQMAAQYQPVGKRSSLRGFVEYLSYLEDVGEKTAEVNIQNVLPVMTVHQAKGLEFRIVFMVNLTHKRFPMTERSDYIDFPDELLKEKLPERDPKIAQLEEERRLFYVAMTRAKDKLVLCTVQQYTTNLTPAKPSQYLEEALGKGTPLEITQEYISDSKSGSLVSVETGLSVLVGNVMAQAAHWESEPGRIDESLLKLFREQIHILKNQINVKTIEEVNQVIGSIDRAVQDLLKISWEDDAFNRWLVQLWSGQIENENKRRSFNEPDWKEFLPISDGGLSLTFTDIAQYRDCPRKYHFARVFHLPTEPTIQLKFGSMFHNVLNIFHKSYKREVAKLEDLIKLFEWGWEKANFADDLESRSYKEKALAELPNYFETFKQEKTEIKFTEHPFTLQLDSVLGGKHKFRGRVDRVDLHPDGFYEIIDYKTGKAWTKKELEEDLQLKFYALGAREAWNVEPKYFTYYFVVEEEQKKKRIPKVHSDSELLIAKQEIQAAADGILQEKFDPTPDYQTCKNCDFRLLCDARAV